MEKIYGVLKNYGFVESEIKVYITLLQYGPLSGYEASKKSSVARSKVYGVLSNLESKGLILSSSGEKSTVYKAEKPQKVIDMLKKKVYEDCELLEEYFLKYKEPVDDEVIWNVTDRETILYKLKELISNAQEKIYLQIWKDELSEEVEDLLLKRIEEGIKVKVVLYDKDKNYDTKLTNVFEHGFEDEKLIEFSTRWLNIIVDDNAMLYSSIKNDVNVSGIFTRNKSMVFFAGEYVHHDIYCLKLIKYMNEIDRESSSKYFDKIREE